MRARAVELKTMVGPSTYVVDVLLVSQAILARLAAVTASPERKQLAQPD